ncbi:MAG: recombination mediator RecR [Candidatus Azotimanducaceae bacterium]|uniref:Recombination protein RecR n=1 Tax=OM182 bacterium TaxID=2510334 RepID=A0A520RXY4_9GAMM|nr:MAG: recombination protein RecR [OM182 bacterium]
MQESIIDELKEAFRVLPGVGQKTAQRMVLHLLERDRRGGMHLGQKILEAMERVGQCRMCRNLSEYDICAICDNAQRDHSQLCVVESPVDVIAIEQSASYRGCYFVLMGNLSPIDGIGPEELGMKSLADRCESNIGEVILALGASVEGEATAHYISELLKSMSVKVTRIARGIPIGGELEYVDGNTLALALSGRKPL